MNTEDHIRFILDLLEIITGDEGSKDGTYEDDEDGEKAQEAICKIVDRINNELDKVGDEQQPFIDEQFNEIMEKESIESIVLKIASFPDDFIFTSRKDAELVLKEMRRFLATRGFISLGDLKDLVGIETVYLDQKRGWTNLDDARIDRIKDEHRLRLPEAKEV